MNVFFDIEEAHASVGKNPRLRRVPASTFRRPADASELIMNHPFTMLSSD